NLPRNKRLNTRTGKKKPRRHQRQHGSSSTSPRRLHDRPPPVANTCTCGCKVSVCPQLCSIDTRPTCAPKYLGSAANSSTAALADDQNKPYTRRGRRRASSANAAGKVKTT